MPDLILSPNNYARLMEGLVVTLQVLAGAVILGTVLSVVFGIGRLSTRAWVRRGSSVYIEFARGASAIILLFWMFFALPILFGVRGWSPMTAGILALGMNMGAYGAEIVRGAVKSVAKGQSEAAVALNLTNTQRLRHVVMPQAIPVILPPYGNLVIEVMKGTSLVSLITLSDLAFEVQKLRVNSVVIADSATTPVLYLNVLVIYFLLAFVINQVFKFAERRSAARFGVTPRSSKAARPAAGVGITG
ncbi:MAG TPA: ectoine/hydroxyectoine ABC transporter permease subunit EhuC [Acidimicrobiia bacterium]|nr:ectoine/hydroxyectoine ABC transporter permease subunit EhuC [Acidimicrobiia bacterium]